MAAARAAGISRTTLYALLTDVERRGRAAAVDPPHRGRPPRLVSDALRGVVVALGRGKRIAEVVRAFAVGEATVKRVAKRYGLRRPPAQVSLPALARAAHGVVDMFAAFSVRARVSGGGDARVLAAAMLGVPPAGRGRPAHRDVTSGLTKRLSLLYEESARLVRREDVQVDLGSWMWKAFSDVPAGIVVTFFLYPYPLVLMDLRDPYPGGAIVALRDYWKARGASVVLCRSEREYMKSLLVWLLRPGHPDPRSYMCYRRLVPNLGGYVVSPLEAWRQLS